MDEGPLPVFLDPHRDRFHDPLAAGAPVTGFDVDVKAEETARAVIPLLCAECVAVKNMAAIAAGDTFIMFEKRIVILFHENDSSKSSDPEHFENSPG
jgi:hypothetical protein